MSATALASTLRPAFSVLFCSTPEEVARAFAVRRKVFVEEMGYSEKTKKDRDCDHLVLFRTEPSDGSTEDVGTVRWHAPPSKLGRMAITKPYRGTGAGRVLCLALEEHLRQRKGLSRERFAGQGEAELWANSVLSAKGFYQRLGYEVEGEEFLEAGEPHFKVTKRIHLVPERST
ncbi:hypothetical protein JCM6882_002859 [Rhodosporidiobolus microsporus]